MGAWVALDNGRLMAVTLGSTYDICYTLSEPDKAGQARLKRYALQNVARELLPDERVRFCLRHMAPGAPGVDVLYDEKHSRAHYGNLMTCGSVWVCPVCASKITERRRGEVETVLNSGKFKTVFMVTVTLRHAPGDTLNELVEALNDAVRRLKMGKAWKTFMKKWGIISYVTGLEVTYGENGWHPHKHMLFFSELEPGDIDTEQVQAWVSRRYGRILARRGYYSSPVYGVDVQLGNDAAGRYITKWGVASELTKAPVKMGKNGSYTPFQLLELAGQGEEWAKRLFVEYARAMKGRRLLSWAHGARELFALGEELSDEEVANLKEEHAVTLVTFTPGQWRQVLANDIRGEVLEVASTGDILKVWGYLARFNISPGETQWDGALFPT